MFVLVNVLYVVVISKGAILTSTALGNACMFTKQSGLGDQKMRFVIDISSVKSENEIWALCS